MKIKVTAYNLLVSTLVSTVLSLTTVIVPATLLFDSDSKFLRISFLISYIVTGLCTSCILYFLSTHTYAESKIWKTAATLIFSFCFLILTAVVIL